MCRPCSSSKPHTDPARAAARSRVRISRQDQHNAAVCAACALRSPGLLCGTFNPNLLCRQTWAQRHLTPPGCRTFVVWPLIAIGQLGAIACVVRPAQLGTFVVLSERDGCNDGRNHNSSWKAMNVPPPASCMDSNGLTRTMPILRTRITHMHAQRDHVRTWSSLSAARQTRAPYAPAAATHTVTRGQRARLRQLTAAHSVHLWRRPHT